MSFIRHPLNFPSICPPTYPSILSSIIRPSIHSPNRYSQRVLTQAQGQQRLKPEKPLSPPGVGIWRGETTTYSLHPGCHPYFSDGKVEIQGLQRKKTSCLLGTITRKQDGRRQYAPSRGELVSDPGLPHLPRASALGPLALGARQVGGQRWRREALGVLTVLGDHCSIYRARQG